MGSKRTTLTYKGFYLVCGSSWFSCFIKTAFQTLSELCRYVSLHLSQRGKRSLLNC